MAANDGFTEKQELALLKSHELELDDSPHGGTLKDIADAFDVSRETASQLAQRGHRQLIEATLGTQIS